MIEEHEKNENYCRMLGHALPFHYCRTMNSGLPCGRILDCWFERIAIQEFIAKNYNQEEQQRIFEPPKTKMLSLVEIIEKAQQRAKKAKEEK